MENDNHSLIVTVIAIVFAPLLAILVSRILDANNQKGNRRLNIYQTLVRTRLDHHSAVHNNTLDTIRIEYPISINILYFFRYKSTKNTNIIEALDAYIKKKMKSVDERDIQYSKIHFNEVMTLQNKLLVLIGESIGQKFDPSDYITS